jgi:thioredoxin reductase (NADPH)
MTGSRELICSEAICDSFDTNIISGNYDEAIIEETVMRDFIIIGSGPAGLSASVYARRGGMDALVVEKNTYGSGQIMGSPRVDNYLGLPGLSGYELGESFRQHALSMDVPFLEGTVTGIRRRDNRSWEVVLEDGSRHEAHAIIYAAGTTPRNLGIPGEARLAGRGIHSCVVCDGPFYRGKSVAVVGGGDSALDSALYLSTICDRVHLINIDREFSGNPGTLERLSGLGNVRIVTECTVKQVQGGSKLESLDLSNGRSIRVDGLFEAIGAVPNTDLVRGLAELDEDGYIIAGESCATSAAGIFAAGDVRTKLLRQVVTAVADGAAAIYTAAHYLKTVRRDRG